jgi:hypothetical protein
MIDLLKRLLRGVAWTLLALVGTILTLLLMIFAWPVFAFLATSAGAIILFFIASHMIMPAP